MYIISNCIQRTFNKIRLGDAGAYFCAFHNQSKKMDVSLLAFRAETLDEASPIAMAQTWERLSGYNVIGNMIYVDG